MLGDDDVGKGLDVRSVVLGMVRDRRKEGGEGVVGMEEDQARGRSHQAVLS